MKDCEADAETGLDVQDTCCTSMREMGMEWGGWETVRLQCRGREGEKEGGRLGRRVLDCSAFPITFSKEEGESLTQSHLSQDLVFPE